MQRAFPDLFEAQPDLLFQLVTMLNPTVLRDSGVPVCTTTQVRGVEVLCAIAVYGGFGGGGMVRRVFHLSWRPVELWCDV